MYDRGLSILEQYDLTATNTYRGRGSLICNTQQGLVLIKEFQGSAKKLVQQEVLQKQLEAGELLIDTVYANQEGQLVSFDKDNIPYYLRRWYEGRECDTKAKEDILRSIKALASLHKIMHMPVEENYVKESLLQEYGRHNAELRKIQKFIRSKRQKNRFELRYLESVGWYLAQGEEVIRQLIASDYDTLRKDAMSRGDICHGEFNQHNVLFVNQKIAVTNFDKWNYDIQTADLYQFMRKILEKHNWDKELGKQMLEEYNKERPLSGMELDNLRLRFAYPEKFWKLANYYYNHKKAWVSQKSEEKLDTLIAQKGVWLGFLEEMCKMRGKN